MKSIKAKVSLLLIPVMCVLMLLGNVYFFWSVQEMFLNRIVQEQTSVAASNRTGLEYFLKTIDQASQFLIADKSTGDMLTRDYDDPLERYLAKSNMNKQFSQCTNVLNGLDGYAYRSTLFLADYIPLAKAYPIADLSGDQDYLSVICRNTQVKEEDWYKKVMELNSGLHIFLSADGGQICFARRVLNLYYAGPHVEQGIGVMVTQIGSDQLAGFFQISEITPNTQVYLLNSYFNVLYEANRAPHQPLPSFLAPGLPSNTLIGEKYEENGIPYIVHKSELQGGLTLAFLTPDSDLDNQLNPLRRLFLLGSAAIVAIVTIVCLLLIRGFTRPVLSLSKIMNSVRDPRSLNPEKFSSRRKDEIGGLYRSFGTMVSEINTLFDEAAKQTALQKEAELKALQAQINPHFLYNAMDSVSWLALTNGQDDISDMVSLISSIMRYAISSPDNIVTLQNELENAKAYVSLQNVRYKGRILLEADVPEECLDISLPKLMLQPLIENSILHGIPDSQSPLHIWISACLKDGTFYLTETDDGLGGDSVSLNRYLRGEKNDLKVRGGFGIRSVNERLALKFQGAGRLVYRNLENGKLEAVIEIRLPQYSAEPEKNPPQPTI